MIIWKGLGFVIIVIFIVVNLFIQFLVNQITGNPQFFDTHKWVYTFSLVLNGIIFWYLGRYLNKPNDRTLYDKATGEEVILKSGIHTLFFIPIEYWSVISCIFAICNQLFW